jgi:hypothetical protein
MPAFPTLKTGAVAQYPLERGVRFSTQAIQFLDGSQQKYRLHGTGLRRWAVRLTRLDEQELSALIAFVESETGAAFSFTDPLTGVQVPNCIIAGERFEGRMASELRGDTNLVIEELA